MRIGLDRISDLDLGGKRIGLVTNDSAFDSAYRRSKDVVAQACDLVALYAAEHGLGGQVAAGDRFDDSVDSESALMVRSLYQGEGLGLDPRRFDDIDLIIFDIQDVGLRFYTYISTLRQILALEIPTLVLDRPNPLGGERVEGVLLKAEYESFVGPRDLPSRYGLTIGELGHWMRAVYGYSGPYSVAWVEGWQRSMTWRELRRPWVMTSPALAHCDGLFCYAGFCLLEGTNLSEGRGTSAPFELFGAPYIDRLLLCSQVERLGLEGVVFTPVSFVPTASKWAGQLCHGLYAHITDHHRFRPFESAVRVIATVKNLFGEEFGWLPTFERLAGFPCAMMEGAQVEEILWSARSDSETFEREKRAYEYYR